MAQKRSPEFCLSLHIGIFRKLTMSLATLAQGHFGPRGIIYGNFLEVHKVMLHIKYQSSRPYGFRQEDFFMFLPI